MISRRCVSAITASATSRSVLPLALSNNIINNNNNNSINNSSSSSLLLSQPIRSIATQSIKSFLASPSTSTSASTSIPSTTTTTTTTTTTKKPRHSTTDTTKLATTYSKLLQQAAVRGDTKEAENIWNSMPNHVKDDINRSLYVRAYAVAGDVQTVEQKYQQYRQAGSVDSTLAFWRLYAYIQARKLASKNSGNDNKIKNSSNSDTSNNNNNNSNSNNQQKIPTFAEIENIWQDVKPNMNVFGYNLMLSEYAQQAQAQTHMGQQQQHITKAEQIFQELINAPAGSLLTADTVSFNTMIHLCLQHNRFIQATHYWSLMDERRVMKSGRSYELMIRHYAQQKQNHSHEALRLFSEAFRQGVTHEPQTFVSLLQMFARAKDGASVNDCQQMFREAHAMNPESFLAVLNACVESGLHDHVAALMSMVAEHRMAATVEYFNIVIKYYLYHYEPSSSSQKQHRKSSSSSSLSENVQKAIQQLTFMRTQYQLQPDVVTYNTLIGYHAKQINNFVECFRLLDDMKQQHIVPNAFTYLSIFQAWARLGEWNKIQRLWADAKNDKIVPNLMWYNVYIDALVKSGQIGEAINQLSDMKKENFKPDVASFHPIINYYAQHNKTREAEFWYHQLLQDRLVPNHHVYTSLLYAHFRLKKPRSCLYWWREMLSRLPHTTPPAETILMMSRMFDYEQDYKRAMMCKRAVVLMKELPQDAMKLLQETVITHPSVRQERLLQIKVKELQQKYANPNKSDTAAAAATATATAAQEKKQSSGDDKKKKKKSDDK